MHTYKYTHTPHTVSSIHNSFPPHTHTPTAPHTFLLFPWHQAVVPISDKQMSPISILPFMSQMFCFHKGELPFVGSGALLFRKVTSKGTVIFSGCGWKAPGKIFRDNLKGEIFWRTGMWALQAQPDSPTHGCVSRGLWVTPTDSLPMGRFLKETSSASLLPRPPSSSQWDLLYC